MCGGFFDNEIIILDPELAKDVVQTKVDICEKRADMIIYM